MRGNWSAGLRRLANSLSRYLHRHEGALPGEVAILGLVPDGPNRRALETISHDAGFVITLVDADGIERECPRWTGPPPIVIYDVCSAPETWRERVRTLARNSPRPYIILLSSKADPNLWDELQRVGGADILRAPINREQLVEAITKGRQLRSAQQHLWSAGCPTTK